MTQVTQSDPQSKNVADGSSPQTSPSEAVNENPLLLDEKQRVAIDLMLTGATLSSVAQSVGIGRKTLYRWRTEDTAFQAELARRRSEILDSSVDRFRDLLGKSMDLIESHLRDPYTITALRAARTLLSMSGVSKIAVPKPQSPATE
jgi:hypothetical protein